MIPCLVLETIPYIRHVGLVRAMLQLPSMQLFGVELLRSDVLVLFKTPGRWQIGLPDLLSLVDVESTGQSTLHGGKALGRETSEVWGRGIAEAIDRSSNVVILC